MGTPGPPGRPLRDVSKLAGLVGQVGHCLENQQVAASNRICCQWEVGQIPRPRPHRFHCRGKIVMYPMSFCLDAMWGALRAPVRLECGADVVRVRQRCYRIRQSCLAQGNARFIFLRFQIKGSSLVISRHCPTCPTSPANFDKSRRAGRARPECTRRADIPPLLDSWVGWTGRTAPGSASVSAVQPRYMRIDAVGHVGLTLLGPRVLVTG